MKLFVASVVVLLLSTAQAGLSPPAAGQSAHPAASANAVPADVKSIGCDLCKLVVQTVADLIGKSEQDIIDAVNDLCEKLGPLADTCIKLADAEIDQIIAWLKSGKTVDEICVDLKLCSSSDPDAVAVNAQLRAMQQQQQQQLAKPQDYPSGGCNTRPYQCTPCQYCYIFVEIVYNWRSKGADKIEIEVEDWCMSLGLINQLCQKKFVPAVPEVLQWLQQGLTYNQICVKLNLCTPTGEAVNALPSAETQQQNAETNAVAKPQPANVGGLECDLCDVLVQTVAKYIDESEQTIIDAVNALCDDLGPLASTCKQLADKEIDQIITWLQSGQTVDQICQDLHMCTANSTTARKQVNAQLQAMHAHKHAVAKPQPANVGGIECDLCDVLVQTVAKYIDESEQTIIDAVNALCDDLGPLASTCKQLADKEIDQIITWLQSGQTVDQICQDLHMCTANSTTARKQGNAQLQAMHAHKHGKVGKVTAAAAVANVKGVGCDLCKVLVQTVADLIGKSEQEIIDAVNDLCEKLGPLASTCIKLADAEVDQIITWLKSGKTVDEICVDLKLCSSSLSAAA